MDKLSHNDYWQDMNRLISFMNRLGVFHEMFARRENYRINFTNDFVPYLQRIKVEVG